jgi:transposase
MNYNQNKKIAQITSETLIIGVDTSKFKHQPELKTLED